MGGGRSGPAHRRADHGRQPARRRRHGTPHTGPERAPYMKENPVIAAVTGLTVEVDGRALVDRVSLSIRPGTVTALVGASGSGKTTTGLALLGAFPAGARVTGEVTVHGTRVG
ncbi:ATP-binding cassette domain-containing protein, partial [Streptomyces sp. NPDC024062]|uniref:ATP-binding cassette domain-containing protein n=1 Tax=Streptomyces sp. NPDC024062 TaxID=3156646 RepID=UPI0034563C20